MDSILTDISDYVHDHDQHSELAYETARWCLMDSGLLCTQLLWLAPVEA